MSGKTIFVPDTEAGDEAVKRLIPNLHKMAEGERDS